MTAHAGAAEAARETPDEHGPGGSGGTQDGESRSTVLAALLANLGVGIAKAAGGLFAGSTALLAEAAHSLADTLNEVFLLLSLSKASRPADRTHPFGYGKERFFWSLLAAVGIFVSGAAFSVAEGVRALLRPGRETSMREFVVIYAVLAFSLVLESASLAKALAQVRREAAGARRPLLTYIRRSPDPTVKTVASEDTIAVLGVLLALAGTVLHQLTRAAAWDAWSSIAIGVLLAYVAFVLGRDTKDLLIGEAADPAVRLTALDVLVAHEQVVAVKEILTMQLGPQSVLVAARVQFEESMTAGELEGLCTAVEQEMRARVPELTQVFLDPSRVSTEDAAALQSRVERTLAEVRGLDGDDGDRQAVARAFQTRTGRRLRGGSQRVS